MKGEGKRERRQEGEVVENNEKGGKMKESEEVTGRQINVHAVDTVSGGHLR